MSEQTIGVRYKVFVVQDKHLIEPDDPRFYWYGYDTQEDAIKAIEDHPVDIYGTHVILTIVIPGFDADFRM